MKRRILAVAATAILGGVGFIPAAVSASTPSVRMGTVHGTFFAGNSSGSFLTPGFELFQQDFKAIDFNPPTGAYAGDVTNAPQCSNNTHVNESTRPFTDVIPRGNGSCAKVVAKGNGYSAGKSPAAFEASFLSELKVSGPGTVKFVVSSDDGFVMGLGPTGSSQPTLVAGPQTNLPQATFIGGFPTLAGDNSGHSATTIYRIAISFPKAGTYPLEFDYAEEGTLGLALTFGTAAGKPLVSSFPTPARTVKMGNVTGTFYANPSGSDSFVPPSTKALFSTVFPVIDFDPPVGAHSGDPKNAPNCSPPSKVTELTAPFTDVIPRYAGGKVHCTLQVAEGNGYQAFVNPVAFEDTMVTSIQVNSAGNQVFNVSADDGFVLGFGKSGGRTPTFVAGPQNGFTVGDKSFASHVPLMFGDNTGHFPTQIYVLVVHFPAAGTYPMEMDHAENGIAATSLTFGQAPNTPLASTVGAEMGSVTGTFYKNPSGSGTFQPPSSKPLFSKTFGAIDFDTPKGVKKGDPPNAPSCSPGNSVNEKTAPFTDVVPHYGKAKTTCTLQPATGNGHTIFVKPKAFEDTMVASLHVDSAGDHTFAVSADDGFEAAFGSSHGKRPTYVSGPRRGFKHGAKSFASHLPLMFGDNASHLPSRINIIVVHFPVAGTYPMEIDHVENGIGYTALTFGSAANVPFASTKLK